MDLKLTIFLLGMALVASLVVFIFSRRKIFSLLLFSILANTVFLGGVITKSDMFDFYNMVWLLYFSFFIWPILNIAFIVYLIKKPISQKK